MNDDLRRDTQPGQAAGEERRAEGWGAASEGPAMGGSDRRPPDRPWTRRFVPQKFREVFLCYLRLVIRHGN